jgi:hypothetical protein
LADWHKYCETRSQDMDKGGRRATPGAAGRLKSEMKHSTTRSLFSYWNTLRAGRMAPRRFEIEPGRIGDILPDTFILERYDAETFPYRLAGTRICERFGREYRGQNFLNGWSPAHLAILRARLNTITVQGGVALFTFEAESRTGKSVLCEMIVLPLVHMHAHADRFLGATSTLETPAWLGYDPLDHRRLLTDEIIWPDGRPQVAEAPDDRQLPFLPHIRTARIVRQDRRQFRVYDGGLSKPDSHDL